jgi:hypothetical protein
MEVPKPPVRPRQRELVAMELVVRETAGGDDEAAQSQREPQGQTCVVVRHSSERPAEFAMRIIRQLATLESCRAHVVSAAVIVDPDQAKRGLAARDLASRAILSHMVARGSGRFTLATEEPCDPVIRAGIHELGTKLVGEIGDADVKVELRFGGSTQTLGDDEESAGRSRRLAVAEQGRYGL